MNIQEKEKDTIIRRMIDSPAELTSADILNILADRELRDLYEISVALNDVLLSRPQPDVDAAWQELLPKISTSPHSPHLSVTKAPRKSPYRRFIPLVAAVMLLLITVALTWILSPAHPFSSSESVVASTENLLQPALQVAAPPKVAPIAESSEPVSPDFTPKAGSPASAVEEFDIDEFITVEQARIDNEIALAMAQVYLDEYNAYSEVASQLDDFEYTQSTARYFDIPRSQIDKLTLE